MLSHLNLGLLVDGLFLFPDHHLSVIEIIGNIDLDTKLITELVDTRALRTDNTPDIFFVNVEFC
jgi:hypothetical protein